MTKQDIYPLSIDLSDNTWKTFKPEMLSFADQLRNPAVRLMDFIVGSTPFSESCRTDRRGLLIPHLGCGVVGLVTDSPEIDALDVVNYARQNDGKPLEPLVIQVVGPESFMVFNELAATLADQGCEVSDREDGQFVASDIESGSSSTIVVIKGFSVPHLLKTMQEYTTAYSS